MSGVVEEILPRRAAIDRVCEALSFPWEVKVKRRPLGEAFLFRTKTPLVALEPHPPYTRSLRDGYAVRSADVLGASPSSPVFLKLCGEIPMGVLPNEPLPPGGAMLIHTGAALPEGADAVVMIEETSIVGDWVEIRSAVARGDYVIQKGEEFGENELLLDQGVRIDSQTIPLLATLGVTEIATIDLKVGILSTGDEIVPVETHPLFPGKIRDVNGWFLEFCLRNNGFTTVRLGIVPDDREKLKETVDKALSEMGCDVLVLSGGSSVSVRDYSLEVLESLPNPGLILRGINLSPGKPTLIGGSLSPRKLVIGLPGHPLSCAVVAKVVMMPLLFRMIGACEKPFKVNLPAGEDIIGQAGVEEFYPAFIHEGHIFVVRSKSAYVASLAKSIGLICLPFDRETVRKGEGVEVWLG